MSGLTLLSIPEYFISDRNLYPEIETQISPHMCFYIIISEKNNYFDMNGLMVNKCKPQNIIFEIVSVVFKSNCVRKFEITKTFRKIVGTGKSICFTIKDN